MYGLGAEAGGKKNAEEYMISVIEEPMEPWSIDSIVYAIGPRDALR